MRYADQHMHCRCSFDAKGGISEMAAAAKAAGMSRVCFTDHMDMACHRDGRATPETLEERWPAFAARRAEYEAAPVPGLEVCFGMELGECTQAPEAAARAAAMPGLDLVIGSLHNLPDRQDFYWIPYESEAQCEALNREYLAALYATAALDCFDVMGHVGYTSRYMAQRGFAERVTVEKYSEELTAIFRRLIEGGRGIECNASGYAGGGAAPYPDADVLRLYRSLGGEIITVGGDAHVPELAAAGLVRRAYALLRECGFKAVCEFRGRRITFKDLL